MDDLINMQGSDISSEAGSGEGLGGFEGFRVLIIEDHAVFRSGLRMLLTDANPSVELGEAKDGHEAQAMLQEQNWDIVISDLSLPDEKGLKMLRDIKDANPSLPVLILSMHPEDQYAVRALKAGASGYLNKNCKPEEIVDAVNKIAKGGKYITLSVAEKLANSLDPNSSDVPHERLSNREMQIFLELAQGKSVSEIGNELSLSVKTVSVHRANILKKMQLKHNAELMFYAIDNDLISS